MRKDLPLEASLPAKKRKTSRLAKKKQEKITTQENMKTHIDNMLPADLESVVLAASSVSCKWPRNFANFISCKDPRDNAPLALFRRMHRLHPDLMDDAATTLTERHPLKSGQFGKSVDAYTIAATVIVFGMTSGLSMADALAAIRPIPVEPAVSSLLEVKKPLHPITVCNTTVSPTDFTSLDPGQDLHDQV